MNNDIYTNVEFVLYAKEYRNHADCLLKTG